MDTQYCRQCGARIVSQARFCRACGAVVAKPIRDTAIPKPQPRRRQPSTTLLTLGAIGAILLIVTGVLLAINLDRPASPVASTLPDEHDAEGIPYPEVARILPDAAKARYDAGQAIFVDVRSQGEYDKAHVAKAVLVSLADIETRYRELPKNAEIITYCT